MCQYGFRSLIFIYKLKKQFLSTLHSILVWCCQAKGELTPVRWVWGLTAHYVLCSATVQCTMLGGGCHSNAMNFSSTQKLAFLNFSRRNKKRPVRWTYLDGHFVQFLLCATTCNVCTAFNTTLSQNKISLQPFTDLSFMAEKLESLEFVKESIWSFHYQTVKNKNLQLNMNIL